jgi:hypothetical protein
MILKFNQHMSLSSVFLPSSFRLAFSSSARFLVMPHPVFFHLPKTLLCLAAERQFFELSNLAASFRTASFQLLLGYPAGLLLRDLNTYLFHAKEPFLRS